MLLHSGHGIVLLTAVKVLIGNQVTVIVTGSVLKKSRPTIFSECQWFVKCAFNNARLVVKSFVSSYKSRE